MSPKAPHKPKVKSEWSEWEWKEDLGKYRSYRWNPNAAKKEYRYQYSLMKSPANTKDKFTDWSEWTWRPEQGVWISWRLNEAGELEEQPAEPIPPAPLNSNPGDLPQVPAQAALPSTTAPPTVPVPPKEPEPVEDKLVPRTLLPDSRPSGDVHLYMPVNINFYENSFNQRPTNLFDPYPREFGYWCDPEPNYRHFNDSDNQAPRNFGHLPPSERSLPPLRRNRSYSPFRTHYIKDIDNYTRMGPVSNWRPLTLPQPHCFD